jgi:hypothetical protein
MPAVLHNPPRPEAVRAAIIARQKARIGWVILAGGGVKSGFSQSDQTNQTW